MPESFGPPAGFDFRGLGLVSGAALGLVWGLVRGNAAGWGSVEVVAALAAGAALAVGFVLAELRAPAPMLPMRLFRSRAFSAGNAVIFFLNAALTGGVYMMAQFQQVALGHRPLVAAGHVRTGHSVSKRSAAAVGRTLSPSRIARPAATSASTAASTSGRSSLSPNAILEMSSPSGGGTVISSSSTQRWT